MEEKKINIGQLAELSGVSRRTIRFYVQNGLLQPPLGAGRGHYYTEDHLRDLLRIKTLKENNLSLEEVAGQLRGKNEPDSAAYPLPTAWVRIEVGPGIELNVQGGVYPVTPARIRKLQKFVHQLFGTNSTQGEVSDE